ncbi:MAG TPA: hypothetical protein VFX33_05810, partial [Actinomycetales bacterium]|nr:hypothetical protein [Actinomycetales bacterium]
MSTKVRTATEFLEGGVAVAAATLTAPLSRAWYNHWGATRDEATGDMPGDELVPHPNMASTRAITIGAPPEQVWPWLVQLGQGRGGFYSYDALENLIGCDIHSADRILPEHQGLAVGDLIRLAPGDTPCYRVAAIAKPHLIVLLGADPVTHEIPNTPVAEREMGLTWAWHLRPLRHERATRLIARQRYSYPAKQSVLWHVVEPIDFAMERRMLYGIRERAEGLAVKASAALRDPVRDQVVRQ